MEEPEFQTVITALSNLFPTLADRLTPEQVEVWRQACRPLNAERVKTVLMSWYRTEEGWPVLARIVSNSKAWNDFGPNVSRRSHTPELTDRDRAAYKPGLARMREVLEQVKKGKATQ